MSLHHLPPATALVECSGTVHRILWRGGQLETPSHRDPEAERAMAALGGPACHCVALLDAWRSHADDPRVLVLGPRGPKMTVVQSDSGQSGSSTVYMAGGSAVSEPGPLALEDLLMLRGSLTRRLVATSASALIARTAEGPGSRVLHAALYGRLLVSLGRWLGELPELELELIGAGADPSLVVDGSRVRAAVAPDWLVDVWGAGLEIVADRFTLIAVRSDDDPEVRLRGVDQLLAVTETGLRVR